MWLKSLSLLGLLFKVAKQQLFPIIQQIAQFLFVFIFDRIWPVDKVSVNIIDKNGTINHGNNKDINTTRQQQQYSTKEPQQLKVRYQHKTSAAKSCIKVMNNSIRLFLMIFIGNLVSHAIYNIYLGYSKHSSEYVSNVYILDQCRLFQAYESSFFSTQCKDAEDKIDRASYPIVAAFEYSFKETKLCGGQNCLDFLVDLSPQAIRVVFIGCACIVMIIIVLYLALGLLDKYSLYYKNRDELEQRQTVTGSGATIVK